MKKYNQGGIYTAEMGQPPMDPEGAPPSKKSASKAPPPKQPVPRDTVFREGMPVPQDIDGGSAPRKKKMASGGYTRAADGCATKGKTKGKMIKMNYGGMC
jgi:hypothetical protein